MKVVFLKPDADDETIQAFVDLMAEQAEESIAKHDGPGAHSGTGTPQSVHAGGVGQLSVAQPGRSETSESKGEFDYLELHDSDWDSLVERSNAPGGRKDYEAKTLAKAQGLAGFEDAESNDEIIERMADNIEAVYDLEGGSADPGWYAEANRLGVEWAEYAKVHPDVAYAVTARLSPGTSWENNIAQAEITMKLLGDDTMVTPEIAAMAQELANIPKTPRDLGDIAGKRLSELSPEQAAWAIRATSDLMEWTQSNGDGIGWQSEYNIASAVSIFRAMQPGGKGPAEVSRLMGMGPKIRSFYNNIRRPETSKEVCVDTHSFGIALGLPVTVSSWEVDTAKVSLGATRGETGGAFLTKPSSVKAGLPGVYGLVAEAHRRVAERRGVVPSTVQAVTWQNWNKGGLWPEGARETWVVNTIRGVHRDHGFGAEADRLIAKVRRFAPSLGDTAGVSTIYDAIGDDKTSILVTPLVERLRERGADDELAALVTRWANQFGSGIVVGADDRQD